MNKTIPCMVSAGTHALPNASRPARAPWGPFADPERVGQVRQYRELDLYWQVFDDMLTAKQQPKIEDVEEAFKLCAALGDRAPPIPERVAQHLTEWKKTPIRRGRPKGIHVRTYIAYWQAVRYVQWQRPNPQTGKISTIANALDESGFGVCVKTYEIWRNRIPLPEQGE